MKRNIQRAELAAGMVILLGGLLTYGLGIHALLPVPRPDLIVYGTTLIGMMLLLQGCDLLSKPTKEMQILEKDERNVAIMHASGACAYQVTLFLLVMALFALIFTGYMNQVVFFTIAAVVGVGQIAWLLTARHLEKRM